MHEPREFLRASFRASAVVSATRDVAGYAPLRRVGRASHRGGSFSERLPLVDEDLLVKHVVADETKPSGRRLLSIPPSRG